QARLRHRAQGAGVLGVEDVGRRALALLEDLRGHLGGVAVPPLALDPRLLLEPFQQRPHQLLAAPAVDGDGPVTGLRWLWILLVAAARRDSRRADRRHSHRHYPP